MAEPRQRLGKLFAALGDPSARAAALCAIDTSIAETGLGWGWVADAIAAADDDSGARERLLVRLVHEKLSALLADPSALKTAEAVVVARVSEALAPDGGTRLPVSDLVAVVDLAGVVRRRSGRAGVRT